jgi:hypothetical protein
MTPERIAELKELAEKATDKHIRPGVRNFWGNRCAEYDPACNTCRAWKEIDDGAAARTAVPELVAEVERLREALKKSDTILRAYASPYNVVMNAILRENRAALGGQP